MNVKFYSLSTLPTAVAGAAGSFVNVTTGADAGMYYCTGAGYLKLDNVAQDKAGEIKTATVDTTTGTASFKNADGTEVFTLALAEYITAEVAKLTGSATIASVADGVVTIKSGVSEADGKIANATGDDITLAKVATTGKADDILLNPSIQFESEEQVTVQDAIEALADAFNGIAKDAADAIKEHTEDDDIHVTADDKTTWSGKLSGVKNADADQYVKVSDKDANNEQTLSVTVGSFSVPAVKDGDGNTVTEAVAQVKGLATVEDVEKVITDNEAVTTSALAELKTASHTHANKSELDLIQTGDVAKWNAKQDAIAENTYDAYGAASTAKSEVIGADTDTKDSDTVKGAKAYADSLAGNYDASGAAAAVQGNTTETVKSLADKIETINGEGEGSIKKAAADAVATVVAGADSDFDTLKEVADWIANDKTGAAALQAASHTHDNKTVLDGITDEKVAAWDAASTANHSHTNKAELDKIADGDKAKWDAYATSKQDALTEAEIAAVDSGITADKVSAYDTHIADTTIHVTADDKATWSGKQDALANAAELAKVKDGDVAKWDAKQDAIAENTYDAYGAADAVLGKDTDTKDSATVYGAKAYAKDYADGLASNYDEAGAASTAKSEVIGTADDTKDSDTINGAKAYADAAVEAATLVWLTEFPTA